MSTDPADDRRSGGRPRSKKAHAAILDATLDLLAEVGYARLTVEGIAARAGVAKTTIYRWWPTKSALAAEALGTGSAPAAVAPTGDLRTDVRDAVRSAVEGYARSPVGTALPGVVAELLQDREAAELLDDLLHPNRAVLEQIVHDAARRGELPDDTDAELLHEVVAGTLLYRLLRDRRATDGVAEELVALLLDGLAARRAAPR